MMRFYATLLDSDGKPMSDLEFGASISESAAACAAVRVANEWKQDACVVRLSSNARGISSQDVVQTVRYTPGGVVSPPEPEPEPKERPAFDRHNIHNAGLLEAWDFLVKWTRQGYTVTVQPLAPDKLNAEASKRNA